MKTDQDEEYHMKLTLQGIQDTAAYEKAGIRLPDYDIGSMRNKTIQSPRWVHFGIGNIFRIFIGGIADELLNRKETDSGIVCVETFDYEVVEKIYRPYDNLALAVTLYGDGTSDRKVIGSLAEAIAAKAGDTASRSRLKEIFVSPSLQMVSFTITEKGYALRDAAGEWLPSVKADIENGPACTQSAVALVTSLLKDRFEAGKLPLALVSMDNVSHNGEKLRSAVLEIAAAWQEKGYVSEEFIRYVSDESAVSFPWSMIDKITPRPSEDVAAMLAELGMEDMDIVITDRRTYIAPFVNAEAPQYLVVEDSFPNGRPPLEKAGVYMTDRETVNASERMKVTVCLNPLHTALAPYGCVLGYRRFSDVMRDEEMLKLVRLVGPKEGMAVVKDPGILSPQAFIEECINVRFPNEFIPDTPQRIAVDTSQMVGIRFGETIKEYIARDGNAKALLGIPLAIAGWLRYLLAVDDEGRPFELSPDPMNEELQELLKDVRLGQPETYRGQLKGLLANANIFGSDLYEAGIGDLIEQIFREEIGGIHAVRETLKKYL
jgi:fructuronate reductase